MAREVKAGAARAGSVSGVRQLTYLLAGLIAVRGIAAAFIPLSFDESYYWLWSRHLAAGYLDHPPMIAFAIRVGTALFGPTELGVRAVPFLFSVVTSWATWRAAAALTDSEDAGLLAAVLLNLTLMMNAEAMVATPDAPAMAGAALFFYALAEIARGGRKEWWLAAGAAAGFTLLSKYTGFFLGAGALCWLALVPRQRHWFASAWPYLGAALALIMFAPNLVWNATHGWISFARQFGRLDSGGFTLRYLGDFFAGQAALATPFILVLGIAGIVHLSRRAAWRSEPMALAAAFMWPAVVYFLIHALHARVQGNWPSFLYPAFCVAALAAWHASGTGWWNRVLRFSRAAAIPVALAMTIAAYAQVLWAVVPLGRDPAVRLLAVGYQPVADAVDRLRVREDASAILTTSYAQTGWLSFYLPSHAPVVQVNERERWLDEPDPPATLFAGTLLYVTEDWRDKAALLRKRFADVTPIAHLARQRGGRDVEDYTVYRVAHPTGPVLGD